MKKITKIACLLLGLIISVPTVAQKTYYMDPEGSDTNTGTKDAPFATLINVQAVLQAGDFVYINPSTYVVSAHQAPMPTTNNNLYLFDFLLNTSG